MDHRVFVFTVHKAASLGVYEVMRVVARKEAWSLHSANLRRATLTEPTEPGDAEFYQQLIGKTGLVGPVRMPVQLDKNEIKQDRIILHLRDPRDVLVSMFFSWSYSHPGVDDTYREALREKGVNAFALNNSALLKTKYELYISEYLSKPHTTLLRYEDFVLDRPSWLEKFLRASGVKDGIRRYDRLARKNSAEKVRREDVNSHIRKATPGDFREKLDPETINRLNDEWQDILNTLKYPLE